MNDWDWRVSCYYADDVEPPKRPGALAIQTVRKGETSKDIEVAAAKARPDIGRIDVDPLPPGGL